MKKILAIAFVALFTIACSENENNLKINGEIKGLKKGTVYLQEIQDTSVVTIDSVVINGDPRFTFNTYIEEPQILYLHLEKVDNDVLPERFDFFAEKGEMNIRTSLKNFGIDLVVEGSENHKKLEEYRSIVRRFNEQNLELIKDRFTAESTENDSLFDATEKKFDNLLKRKYLYTINFAVNNKDKELAPYITIAEAYDANIKYLDTVYNSLTPQVKNSRYGTDLGNFISERKALEEQ